MCWAGHAAVSHKFVSKPSKQASDSVQVDMALVGAHGRRIVIFAITNWSENFPLDWLKIGHKIARLTVQ